jgi:hypothetical protein
MQPLTCFACRIDVAEMSSEPMSLDQKLLQPLSLINGTYFNVILQVVLVLNIALNQLYSRGLVQSKS